VSCYDNDIIEQLSNCTALLWHVENFNYKDQVFAKYLIQALEDKEINIFPDYHTLWHFDDKVAQKYLLEAINAPLVKTYVFYDKKSALEWIGKSSFPKVFKLRKGAGSKNVLLVKNKSHAKRLIKKAFGKGFPTLNMFSILKERYRNYKLGTETFLGLIKGFIRLFIGEPFLNMSSNEKGYIYFQDFLPNNDSDIRITVTGDKAHGLRRMVRKNDFRASGSGNFIFDRDQVNEECVKIAFDISKKLRVQSMAFDFVNDEMNNPKIVEVSYGFTPSGAAMCPGYWSSDLKWHKEEVLPTKWIIEALLKLTK
jgi:glutathione synthase/RimK-type ligase-like ATP-grasp enzyme